MERVFVIIASILGFLAVGLGAFGAHALRGHFDQFPNLKATYETAVAYHFYHTLALLAVAWAVHRWPSGLMTWAGYLLIIGIIIFSGSLYLLVATNVSRLGAITPIGGVALLAGWACFALGVWRVS